MLPARSAVGYRLGHTHMFQGVASLDKRKQTPPKFAIPSVGVKIAPEQLSTRKLPHKQPAASRISNNIGGVGGAYTTATTPDKSTGRGRGLYRTGGWRPEG